MAVIPTDTEANAMLRRVSKAVHFALNREHTPKVALVSIRVLGALARLAYEGNPELGLVVEGGYNVVYLKAQDTCGERHSVVLGSYKSIQDDQVAFIFDLPEDC